MPKSGDGAEPVLVSTREGENHASFVVSRAKRMARVNVSSLQNGAAYEIEVTAANSAGEVVSATAQPYVPSNLKAEFARVTKVRESGAKTVAALEKKIALAESGQLGPSMEFSLLLDKCVTGKGKDGGMSYRFCGFNSLDQKDGDKWRRVGKWSGWEPAASSGGVMRFSGGERCTDGDKTARSAEVVLSCAAETAIRSTSEPTTCAYRVELATPAACKPSDVPLLWEPVPAAEAGHQEL